MIRSPHPISMTGRSRASGSAAPAPAGSALFPRSRHRLDHPRDLSKISPISLSLTISGGVSAMVSPVTRIMMSSSWNAFSIAS